MITFENPAFQHRAIDEDGFQIIAVGDLAITDHLNQKRNLVFGSWAPGHFDPLTTLVFNAAGAVITGLRSSRVVPRDQFGGDPDGLLRAWYEVTTVDEKHERQRRADALSKRHERERQFYTVATIDDRHVSAFSEIDVRLLLQTKAPLTFGHWDPANDRLKAPIAFLCWEGESKRTIRFQSMFADRSVCFDDVPDLDHVASAWIKFVARERDDFEFAKLVEGAQTQVAQGSAKKGS